MKRKLAQWVVHNKVKMCFCHPTHTITYHIKEIFESGKLERDSTTRKFRVVQMEGSRQVRRDVDHYNLDVVISVGYRVNSMRATQFRRWATQVLSQYSQRGYVIDRKRMENGAFLDEDYFERLLEEIREIRLSERRFYQNITDIYATSVDYDRSSAVTRRFFAKVQNKMHYAVAGYTAAEIIYGKADSQKPYMGLTSWEKAPDGKIVKSDVFIAKNYLSKDEIDGLGRIVNAFLDLAEGAAKRHIPMTMEDWATRIDRFLLADDRDVLRDAGIILTEIARSRAETELEKYRVIQDRLFESDFDKLLNETPTQDE